MNTGTQTVHAALYAADEAFSFRGRSIYGKNWGDARYQGDTWTDPILIALGDAYAALGKAYNRSCTEDRNRA